MVLLSLGTKRNTQFKHGIITISTSAQKFKELLADFALGNKSFKLIFFFCGKFKVIVRSAVYLHAL